MPEPRGGPEASPIPNPPTYKVKPYQHLPSKQRWMAKQSHFKPLLRMRKTYTGPLLFCNFHGAVSPKMCQEIIAD